VKVFHWWMISILVLILAGGCIHRWEVNQLTSVCSRVVNEEGYLITKNAMFGKSGARKHLRENVYSYSGKCFDEGTLGSLLKGGR